jgi:hypothetical protein
VGCYNIPYVYHEKSNILYKLLNSSLLECSPGSIAGRDLFVSGCSSMILVKSLHSTLYMQSKLFTCTTCAKNLLFQYRPLLFLSLCKRLFIQLFVLYSYLWIYDLYKAPSIILLMQANPLRGQVYVYVTFIMKRAIFCISCSNSSLLECSPGSIAGRDLFVSGCSSMILVKSLHGTLYMQSKLFTCTTCAKNLLFQYRPLLFLSLCKRLFIQLVVLYSYLWIYDLYKAPSIILLMQANPLRGQVGGG